MPGGLARAVLTAGGVALLATSAVWLLADSAFTFTGGNGDAWTGWWLWFGAPDVLALVFGAFVVSRAPRIASWTELAGDGREGLLRLPKVLLGLWCVCEALKHIPGLFAPPPLPEGTIMLGMDESRPFRSLVSLALHLALGVVLLAGPARVLRRIRGAVVPIGKRD